MGYKKRDFSNKAGRHKELFFGLAVTAIILGTFTLAAFNGGLSLEAGKLALTIDASWSQGAHQRTGLLLSGLSLPGCLAPFA